MPRPGILTPALTEEIVAHLKRCVPQDTAARYVGISPAAFYKWKARGTLALETATALWENTPLPPFDPADPASHESREAPGAIDFAPAEERIYIEFVESVEAARAEAEVRMVEVVRKAAVEGDVKAAQWWLDRAYPERWAQRQRLELTGAQDGPINILVEYEPGDLTKEEATTDD